MGPIRKVEGKILRRYGYCKYCRWYKGFFCRKYNMLTDELQTCKAWEKKKKEDLKHGERY